jgi:hypothetical protein
LARTKNFVALSFFLISQRFSGHPTYVAPLFAHPPLVVAAPFTDGVLGRAS